MNTRVNGPHGPRIFLAGPPGSGKGTLGARLAAHTGAPHVSTGDLLRALLARGEGAHPRAATIAACMREGRLVPAEIMREVVAARLAEDDCLRAGFVLDGYPPSREDLANLRERGVEPDLVLYLDCPDAIAIARQVARAARDTDTPARARDRLAAFHAAGAGFDALATQWYPRSLVARVDAERPPDAVLATALEVLRNTSETTRHTRSYFPLPPFRTTDVRSTRVHFHVDAPDAAAVRAIAREILTRCKRAQGQLKVYPIEALHLGPQTARLPVYRGMPNFHPIDATRDEAFITGRLGDGDAELTRVVLEVTRERGGMAELESYVGEWTLRRDGAVVTDAAYDLLEPAARYPDFDANRLADIPTWELHHGFDVPKSGGSLPIELADLTTACAEAGLDNGGWFVFKNDAHWAYRSNEFSNASREAATATVLEQARALARILAACRIACDVGFSLERVHGIWTW